MVIKETSKRRKERRNKNKSTWSSSFTEMPQAAVKIVGKYKNAMVFVMSYKTNSSM